MEFECRRLGQHHTLIVDGTLEELTSLKALIEAAIETRTKEGKFEGFRCNEGPSSVFIFCDCETTKWPMSASWLQGDYPEADPKVKRMRAIPK